MVAVYFWNSLGIKDCFLHNGTEEQAYIEYQMRGYPLHRLIDIKEV